MARLGTITFTGVSGARYQFDVYPFGASFKDIGVIYVITNRHPNERGGYSHHRIYIGQTEDLSERFDNHHKYDCFVRENANCICVFGLDSEDRRLDIESDLLDNYSPPCND